MEMRAADHGQAAHSLIDPIGIWAGNEEFQAIGHHIVHGGVRLDRHQVVTPDLVQELRRAQPLDLGTPPREIALIEAFGQRACAVPCRSLASTQSSTDNCRESRRSCPLLGVFSKPAYGVSASPRFRMLTC
jgi:acetate kinase